MVIKKILLASVSSFALVNIIQEGYATLEVVPNPINGSPIGVTKPGTLGMSNPPPGDPANPAQSIGAQASKALKTVLINSGDVNNKSTLSHSIPSSAAQVNDTNRSDDIDHSTDNPNSFSSSLASTTSTVEANPLNSNSFDDSSASTTSSWSSNSFADSSSGSGIYANTTISWFSDTVSSYNSLFPESGSSNPPPPVRSGVPTNPTPSTRAQESGQEQKNVPQKSGGEHNMVPLTQPFPLAEPHINDTNLSSASSTSTAYSNTLTSGSSLTPESSVEVKERTATKTQDIIPHARTEVDVVPSSSSSNGDIEDAYCTTLSDEACLAKFKILYNLACALEVAFETEHDITMAYALARYIEGFPAQDSETVLELRKWREKAGKGAQATAEEIEAYVETLRPVAPSPAVTAGPASAAFGGFGHSMAPGLCQSIGTDGTRRDARTFLGNIDGNGTERSFCFIVCKDIICAFDFYKRMRDGFGVVLYAGRNSSQKNILRADYYVGGMRRDVRHGKGFDSQGGNTYFMTWDNGKQKGHGVKTYANGTVHEGQWNGDKSMTGTMTWLDGTKFAGTWINLEPNKNDEVVWSGNMHRGRWVMEGPGTATYADGRVYDGPFKDDQYHGDGELTRADGAKYTGQFASGKFHGQGTLTWPDGRVYTGQFASGKFHGPGTLTWPDGRVYTGQFASGKFHGPGTLTWPDGRVYTGTWANGQATQGKMEFPKNAMHNLPLGKNGLPHGKGFYTAPDGSRYNGSWVDGEREGCGEYTSSPSDEDTHHAKYRGDWYRNKRAGSGKILNYKDEVVFEGLFDNDLKHGEGRYYVDPDGLDCVGTWEKDEFVTGTVTLPVGKTNTISQNYHAGQKYVRTGRGKLVRGWGFLPENKAPVYFEKDKLEGTYEGATNAKGIPHGKGVLTFISSGTRYEGDWINGTRAGKGIIVLPNGKQKYAGDWVNDVKEGNGVYNFDDGRVYTGQFKEDKMEGTGTMTYPKKPLDFICPKYTGSFVNNMRHGNGKMTYVDLQTYNGEWKEDERDGKGTISFQGKKYEGVWRDGVQVEGEKPQIQSGVSRGMSFASPSAAFRGRPTASQSGASRGMPVAYSFATRGGFVKKNDQNHQSALAAF